MKIYSQELCQLALKMRGLFTRRVSQTSGRKPAERAELAAIRRPSVCRGGAQRHVYAIVRVWSTRLPYQLPVTSSCSSASAGCRPPPSFHSPGYNAPTPQRVESLRVRRRNWEKNGKGVGVGAFFGGGGSTTESSLDKFIFRVQGESATASSFASSIFWSHFPQILYIFPFFFSYVTAFKSPCFCGSVASLYSISFFLCLAPFASLPSLVAHNYTTLLSLKKKTKENKRSPKWDGEWKMIASRIQIMHDN